MPERFRRRFRRRCVVALAPLGVAVLVLPVLVGMVGAGLTTAAVTAGWLLVGIGAVAWWLYQHRLAPVGVRWPVALTWAAGAMSVLRSTAMVVASPWWAGPVWTVLVGFAAAVLGWFLAGADPALPVATAPPEPDKPRLSLSPRTRAMWCRHVRSDRGLAVAVVLAGLGLAGVLTAADTLGIAATLALVLALFLAAQSWASVRVDGRGVTVTQPLLGRALIAVEHANVQHATSLPQPAELPRSGYGVVAAGAVFGYRTRRTGPALRLDLAGGLRCVITVDDPHTAAALVNTQASARWSSEPTRSRSC